MTASIRIIRNRHDHGGADVHVNTRQVVTFGTAPDVDVPLLSLEGHRQPHISRKAGLIGVTAGGQAVVQNLSTKHEIVLRPFGQQNDVPLAPARVTGGSGQHFALADGWWWIRNGQTVTESGRLRHTSDAQTSWLLLHVTGVETAFSSTESATGPLREPFSPVSPHRLSDPQLLAVAMIFRQFLGAPPHVAPAVYTDAELRAMGDADLSRRRSELRRLPGLISRPLDAQWIADLVRTGLVTYEMLWDSQQVRDLLHLRATPR